MDMNDHVISKADLWADRIHAFQESGLSRKDWCQQNEIPQSTLNYWIRKIQLEAPETEPASDPVFAKLPSEQELQFNAGTGNRSVTELYRFSRNHQTEIPSRPVLPLYVRILQSQTHID